MSNYKLIFTNGCYDILHPGHIKLIQYAASLGNKLVVALDTDERVKTNKSINRPINTLQDRMFMMSALKGVDEVVSFGSEEELRSLMKHYNPYYLVIGNDYKGKYVIGEDLVHEVKYFRKIDGYSTTQILEHITSR
jgi:D-beta-D-heptose 7-phosphate kinase/D-beta-D-heptose 1-phosphate adenosyltransferase